ncbi:glutamyl-tRNA amidotransferase [Rugosibacter aromaticivorans]|uniref:Glutamyl-tRNA amidotransferase n=1 Tax=Rugosibacter aromaticivorans TaxID=1565605 RepID=A0A0C5JBD2_9PROT|nr:GatB/YqeY domain-containing protein [Rugosibacter aromaticivorans]AJP49150.1 glutamyl-tRNA amidotransferase [Rugosibacter aromaticivorans]TBR15610.1 MAG: GatB/YqeY domain-containing protein [Rugosibacter sp.]
MTLKDRISEDWKGAMKAGDRPRKEALSLLLAAIKQKQVDERIELNDDGVIAVIEKMLKQRKDSITQYEAAKRQDLADAEKFEAEVLSFYMPQAMDAVQIESIITASIHAVNAALPSDMGKVIAHIKPQVAGRADMGEVSRLVKAKLSALSGA